MCQCEAKVEEKPKHVRYSIQVAPYGEFWIEPENCSLADVGTKGHLHIGRSVITYETELQR
jgi:hypothetical protein